MNINLTECYIKDVSQAKKILEKLIEKERIYITDYEKEQILMLVIKDVVKERDNACVGE